MVYVFYFSESLVQDIVQLNRMLMGTTQSQLLIEGHNIRAMLAEQESESESDSHVVRELLEDAKVQAALTEPRVRTGGNFMFLRLRSFY